MAISVPIGDVLQANHLGPVSGTGLVVSRGRETIPVKLEVYTGWVQPGFRAGGSIAHEEVRTLLPLDNQRNLFTYQQNSLVDFTVTASPATIAPDEDEANLFGVDEAPSVALEPQSFSGVAGNPLCLVLRVVLAGLNVTFHRFTYQVTVLIDARIGTPPIQIDPSERPA
jgi:hypothetical protein